MKKIITSLNILITLTVSSASEAQAENKIPSSCEKTIEFTATDEDRKDNEFIRSKLEAAELLSNALVIAPFAAAFVTTSPVDFVWNATQSDWEAWVEVVSKMDDGIRGILRKHAQEIRTKYDLRNDHKRATYWKCVQTSFN